MFSSLKVKEAVNWSTRLSFFSSSERALPCLSRDRFFLNLFPFLALLFIYFLWHYSRELYFNFVIYLDYLFIINALIFIIYKWWVIASLSLCWLLNSCLFVLLMYLLSFLLLGKITLVFFITVSLLLWFDICILSRFFPFIHDVTASGIFSKATRCSRIYQKWNELCAKIIMLCIL